MNEVLVSRIEMLKISEQHLVSLQADTGRLRAAEQVAETANNDIIKGVALLEQDLADLRTRGKALDVAHAGRMKVAQAKVGLVLLSS
jgi:uncharacterized protein involved in exopolysaccharide biosynthesis